MSRLVGSPPGYVGYEGGQLRRGRTRKPYSVILDETESASDVFNVLLQILDDGRLTDNQGRTVDFKNTIIIMTSNIGSNILLNALNEKGEIDFGAKEEVMAEMRQVFRPEFLNRVDEVVMFKPLRKPEIIKIIDLSLKDLAKRLEDKKISLEVTEEAKDFIADMAYSQVYGARPVKRYIQKNMETEIGKMIIRVPPTKAPHCCRLRR